MRRRKGQILVAAILLVGVLIMGILVSVYQAHGLFLRTRTLVVREIVGAITADFKRALAVGLAAATRAYFNYSEFSAFTERFNDFGLTGRQRRNFTAARMAVIAYLEYWRQAVIRAYGEYGIQVSYEFPTLNLSSELERPRLLQNLLKGFWYYPRSGSYACARLKLNLTNLGFYGWEADVFVGLTVAVNPQPRAITPDNVTLVLNLRVDGVLDYNVTPPLVEGTPYSKLIAEGWIRVYYPEVDESGTFTGKWRLAVIKDVTYEGLGNYTITFEPAVPSLVDPLTGEEYVPVIIVVSEERGIVAVACTYTRLLFAVKRNSRDRLVFYDENGARRRVSRPSSIAHEIYTFGMAADLSLYWLGEKLASTLNLPPVPFIPLKHLKVNVTIDGSWDSFKEVPTQYENWTWIAWHGIRIGWPLGLADPAADFIVENGRETRLVFQVAFPTLSVERQYVAIWWLDDLDSKVPEYATDLDYIEEGAFRDIIQRLFKVELVDAAHALPRGYPSYCGAISAILRDPLSDDVLGALSLQRFDSTLAIEGRYRPYGTWVVYNKYPASSLKPPIRIIAAVNSTRVVDAYSCEILNGYFDTLITLEVANGTRYLSITVYVYWEEEAEGSGYWIFSSDGTFIADRFLYMTAGISTPLKNQTLDSPFKRTDIDEVKLLPDPGIMATYWSNAGDVGIALMLNWSGVENLAALGGDEASFYATERGEMGYLAWPAETYSTVERGSILAYRVTIFLYTLSGEGFLRGLSINRMWRNAYIYSPMFTGEYSPTIEQVEAP